MMSITSRTCKEPSGRCVESSAAVSTGPGTIVSSCVPRVPVAGLVTSCRSMRARGSLECDERPAGARCSDAGPLVQWSAALQEAANANQDPASDMGGAMAVRARGAVS